MQAIYRLQKNRQFDYVYRKGTSTVCKNIVMITAKNNSGNLKVGFSVSKKIGKSVVRNRVKRLMRENFRLLIPTVNHAYNYVFVARAGITESDFAGVKRDLLYLLKKANLLAKETLPKNQNLQET